MQRNKEGYSGRQDKKGKRPNKGGEKGKPGKNLWVKYKEKNKHKRPSQAIPHSPRSL